MGMTRGFIDLQLYLSKPIENIRMVLYVRDDSWFTDLRAPVPCTVWFNRYFQLSHLDYHLSHVLSTKY